MGCSSMVATPHTVRTGRGLGDFHVAGLSSKWPFGPTTDGRADLDPVPDFFSGRLADILDLLPWMALRLDRRA